ncbi:uncharacterized protein UV8b_04702 [Ustilaginoidea virens]|uniref:Cytochrome c oxidase subunit 9, mitochondrial n=1 Tax=Ustilaginoidea virens TaxID=1159556 RepID=A0A8E5MHY9_USTVR|nr:uncharacterized protein UV8b_04702 [Ustilaginoidea virens]QUC20461.1 hypothetical protein UV8b_04702 [Ustilaginoidea virens]
MPAAPITGILRKRLIVDIGVGLGAGFAMANLFWYGFHMPRTNARDDFYTKLEAERAQKQQQ